MKDGATTGKTSFVDDSFPHEHATVYEHLFIVRVDPEEAMPKFVFFYLFSSKGQKEILSDFRGATVGGISRNFSLKVMFQFLRLPNRNRLFLNLSVTFQSLMRQKQLSEQN